MEDKKIKTVKNRSEPKSVHDIQVFLGFANFYQRFIQSFSKIAGLLTLILKTSSLTCALIILQSINAVDEDEVGQSGADKTNLLNQSTSTRFTQTGYLISGSVKRAGRNTKKVLKAARDFNYITPVLVYYLPPYHISTYYLSYNRFPVFIFVLVELSIFKNV